jgi:predicted tellurium resistance membrane protein TerC
MEWLADPNTWIAFLTLCALEIVLGIDNIIFISILTNKLPPEQRPRGRRMGLALALGMRVLLLFSITWIMQLTQPLFTVFNNEITGRDLILLLGGLFLIYKSVKEVHEKFEIGEESELKTKASTFNAIVLQIALIDLVFSLDSVITAVGMVDRIEIMIAAVIVSIGIMMLAAGPISEFVNRHPAIKVLALSFLILIGTALVGEGLNFHIPKGYIYFAMAFSVAVEFVNIKLRVRSSSSSTE